MALGRNSVPETGKTTHLTPDSSNFFRSGPPARRQPTVTEYPSAASRRASSTHCVSDPPSSNNCINRSTRVPSLDESAVFFSSFIFRNAFVKGTVSALSTVFFVWSYALTNSDAFPPPPASRTKAFGWNAAAGFCLVFVSRKLRCQSSRISSCQSSEERSRTP